MRLWRAARLHVRFPMAPSLSPSLLCHFSTPAGDNCSFRRRGEDCRAGTRKENINLVCGAVLPIWCVLCVA